MRQSHPYLGPLVLILLVVLVYGGFFTNAFVYDDELVITKNHFIRDLGNLADVFTPAYFQSGELSYRPVVTLSYFLDHALFGLQRWGYHAHSLILHLAVSLALVWVLAGFGLARWLRWLAGLVFALHPVAVESVATPANREELYCALFMLLAVGFAMRGVRTHAISPASLFFAALALFTKETALMLPFLLIVYWWMRPDENGGPILPARHLGLLFLVVSAYAMLRFVFYVNPVETGMAYLGGSLWANVYGHAAGWVRMLQLFLVPTGLTVEHAFFKDPVLARWAAAGALFVTAMLVGLLLRCRRGLPALSFGAGWMLLTFIPVSGLVPIANVFAERFLYIPILGFAMGVAGLASGLQGRVGKPALVAVVAWILCLGVSSHMRLETWKDGETLWADAVLKNPKSARAHNNLGYAQFDKGFHEDAAREFRLATRLDPQMQEGWRNLANYHDTMGDYPKALDAMDAAFLIDRSRPELMAFYADLLMKVNRWEEAEQYYRRSIAMHDRFAEVWNNLGILLLRQGRGEEARACLERALELLPRYPDALVNLGTAMAEAGDLDAAQDLWRRALEIDPYHTGAQRNLAISMGSDSIDP